MGLDQYIFAKKKDSNEPIKLAQIRKVNCLQGYFEDRYNIDNLELFPLTQDIVKEIITLTDKVLENPSLGASLFPIKIGPFYGNFEYNEYYIEHVKETNLIFKELSQVFNDYEKVFYYSWY